MEYLMPSDNNIIDLATKAYLTDPVPYPGMLMTEKALIEFAKQIIFFDREKFRNEWNKIEKWRGIALAKEGDGRVVTEIEKDAVEQYLKSITTGDMESLMMFYNVQGLQSLILAQAYHVERLQERLYPKNINVPVNPIPPRVG